MMKKKKAKKAGKSRAPSKVKVTAEVKSAPAARKSSKDAVVAILNRARADELAAILQYMAQHYALDDADYGQVASNVKLIAIDEMRHAEMLAERIYEIGGVPVTAPSMRAKREQTIEEAMEQDVGLEVTAIADYNEFIEICRANRDGISAKLLEQIADEEQVHLSYFENVQNHIKQLGAVYLAQITGGPADAGTTGTPGFVASKGGA